MIRILADENLHAGIVDGLRHGGHEVVFAPDVGLGATEDRAILDYTDNRTPLPTQAMSLTNQRCRARILIWRTHSRLC